VSSASTLAGSLSSSIGGAFEELLTPTLLRRSSMSASAFAPGTTGEGPLVPAMAQAEMPGGVSVSMTDAVDPPAATSAVTESPIVPTFAKKKKKKKKKIQQPSFSDQYDYTGKVLGDGSYAIVHEIIERRSNTALAVKVITKDMPEHLTQHVRDQVYQEMDLLTEVKVRCFGSNYNLESACPALLNPSSDRGASTCSNDNWVASSGSPEHHRVHCIFRDAE